MGHMLTMQNDDQVLFSRDCQLRLADHIGITSGCAGEAVIFDFANPDRHWYVPDKARLLLSCFRCDKSTPVTEVVSRATHLFGSSTRKDNIDAVYALISELIRIGVLIDYNQRQGFYTAQMCSAYALTREVPEQICRTIINEGNIQKHTSVLDIGTGPGSIANALGLVSDCVIGGDISNAFLDVARSRARTIGSKATFIRFDANKLLFSKVAYEIVTASQMLHWLDPSWAVRGLYHGLVTEGSLFVAEIKPALRREHPLRDLLGAASIDKDKVVAECARHAVDYQTLFERIRPHGVYLNLKAAWIFRQRKLFDMNFARAYFFDSRIQAVFAGCDEPWEALQHRFDQINLGDASGEMYWLLLHFKKEINPRCYIDSTELCRSVVEVI